MPTATLLPFTNTPSRKSASPSAFRLTEKFILLLVFSAFITLCFGAIFFLPDSSKLLSGVFFHSSSVEADTKTGTDSNGSIHGADSDENKLTRIRKDHEKALSEAKDTLQKRPDEIQREIQNEKEKVQKNVDVSRGGGDGNSLPKINFHKPPGAIGREPSDQETKEKRAKIQEICFFET
ncbi:Mannosyl-oligosaccharide 1,2-alpha-mannosidase IA [Acipenser ruthenus]|uniref:Mannosyl-oligosaccharide 1,2-alpha-mannosidase IA n=1 Tax=Acipenser ruthenus TaxID=7906 RepID=A0A662YP43_ACIRT|nr:Mannosyl-oligosaccharide 1,2-alpha-mannosidase IA [Acipenser ruthenus]